MKEDRRACERYSLKLGMVMFVGGALHRGPIQMIKPLKGPAKALAAWQIICKCIVYSHSSQVSHSFPQGHDFVVVCLPSSPSIHSNENKRCSAPAAWSMCKPRGAWQSWPKNKIIPSLSNSNFHAKCARTMCANP